MKKFTFILLSFFLSIFVFGQQVDRNYVVVEIGTGTWCQYCPGAAMGADDLVENGHDVAIIENHNGDSFTTTSSNSRNTFYNITGFPTAYFDGNDNIVGGSHTSSLYQTYLPKYNNAIAVMSDFTMDLSYSHTGAYYNVAINITEPGNYTGTNLVVHLFLTESHISYSWQGQEELNFVNRAMYPNQNGTSFSGGTQTINVNFTADAGWVLSNCELVAFIQDKDTKHILQADKATLAEPSGTNNISLVEINELSDVCEGVITPSLKVKNLGSSDISSLVIDYSINGGATTGTYNWTGEPIAFNSFATITMDEVIFDLLANNSIDIDISQVNGGADDEAANNTGNASFDKAPEGTMHVFLTLHTDGWGSECTWNIKNSAGVILKNGGPYGNNQTINEDFFIAPDCSTFNLFDQYGDGGGSVTLEDSEGQIFFYTPGSYGSGISQKFTTFAIAPTVSFSPVDGTDNVNPNADIIITFDQAVRKINNSEITDADISSFVSLSDPSKGAISYTGTINTEKTIITINPDNALPQLTDITVTVSGNTVENAYDQSLEESSATFTTKSTVGVSDISKNFAIVPNPANNYIFVKGINKGKLIISNISGKQIFSQKINSDNTQINIRNLTSGIYFVTILIDNKVYTQKLVKK